MPEQFKPYNLDQARDEATKMEEKIKRGEVNDYKEAGEKVEQEEKEPKIETVEEIDKEIKKRENNILNFLKYYYTAKRKNKNLEDKNFTKYFEKYPNNNKIGFGERAILEKIANYEYQHGPMFESIFDENVKKQIVENVLFDFDSENAISRVSFTNQIIRINPDIIFLCARAAVSYGIIYKEFIKNLKKTLIQEGNIDSVAKIPNPEFKLADVKLRNLNDNFEKEGKDIDLYRRAVNRYEKKLEPIKQKVKNGALKEPVSVAIFDESIGNTGSTLRNQELAIQEAAKKLGIDVSIKRFDYVTINPNQISPIHYINEDKIARRGPRGKELLEKFKTMDRYQIEKLLSDVVFYKMCEKTSLQILITVGKKLASSKEDVEYFLKDLRNLNKWRQKKE